MEVREIHMLRWICDKTIMDKIRNQEFREKLGVASLSVKMRENRLRWFGHVQRMTHDGPVRRIECIIVEGKRSRERSRRTWEEQIKSDLHELHLSNDLTRDRASWRCLIHVLDY
ncbi:uncharacterized protein LOC130818199 [Amaranthus tricolor]|uniref:uncharacterized protein LOC130818199 n=1 Tax=Amaranthus tricolor TaxID=29722 RepID=UPI00259083FB|nr:uncharacterized protein LOC130818199 [Amaranthus tricolor]